MTTPSRVLGGLRFADDDDLLRYEPTLDDVYPRRDPEGQVIRTWDTQIELAMEELARRMRSRGHNTTDLFEVHKIGHRSREFLRPAVVCFALHFIFIAADTAMDDRGFFARKASHYWKLGGEIIEAESGNIDYDDDASGTISDEEELQAMPNRFRRG